MGRKLLIYLIFVAISWGSIINLFLINNFINHLVSDQTSNLDQSVIELVDKPNLITILVGGIIMATILFFIFGKIFVSWEFVSYLQFGIALIIIVISYVAGRQVDGLIRINPINGWVYAKNKTQFWEGYCSDLTQFMVLQNEEEDHTGNKITKFMIYLELSDNSKYQIKLKLDEVKDVMKAVESAKENVATGRMY